MVFQL